MVSLKAAAVLALLAQLTASQGTGTQYTWASVVFVYSGESTPSLTNSDPILTPLGAHQAYAAGDTIRTRYLVGPGSNITTSFPIQGIAKYVIDNTQLGILARDQQWLIATGQAFFQGLYPPLVTAEIDAVTTMADGTLLQYPLDGYQYPDLSTASALDFEYISIAGDLECPEYELSAFDYFQNSTDFAEINVNTAVFYQELVPLLYQNVVPATLVKYLNAYVLWEYAQYQYNHNATVAAQLAPGDLAQLRYLASVREFALNGDLTASGAVLGDAIRTIAGQTLAGIVLDQLASNIGSRGESYKLSLLFSSFEPFLAFWALSGLSAHDPTFTSLPEHGSTMMFELFSVGNSTTFPDPSQLHVRFLFRNGTSNAAPVRSYPLFGLGLSQTDMTWTNFLSMMSDIAMNDVGTWCITCQSLAIFCPAVTSNVGSNYSTPNPSPSSSSSSVSSTVAGVIGAAVTVFVLFVLAVAAIFCCGFSVSRHGANRTSTLGGFKGAEKLASDTDLSVVKKGTGAGAAVIRHERVGSWELTEANKDAGETSMDARMSGAERVVSNADYSARDREDNEDELRVNPFTDPVKAVERV